MSHSILYAAGSVVRRIWLPTTAILITLLCVGWPLSTLAQATSPDVTQTTTAVAPTVPVYWYLLAAAFSMFVPAGFVLVSLCGLSAKQAWDTALGGVGALGLAGAGYWAIGFALQFGGIGLVYTQPELRGLVWEWSPLSSEWGMGWGMAGLSGWFLSGRDVTALTYALFLAHMPWAMSAALLPMLAIRGRAPALVSLLMALLVGAIIYPLAGNWVHGGGWLSALGRNMQLGHGTLDFGGAATVHLLAAGVGLAALTVWTPRRQRTAQNEVLLPATETPLLAVAGSLFLIGGSIGWQWANPLQFSALDDATILRGAINAVLCASAGVIVPLLYTWFISGSSEPQISARGVAAGVVASMACGPFVQPGIAFLIGLLAGASVPFVTYMCDHVLRLDDATGILSICGAPALISLVLVGVFADGVAGRGWQMTGLEEHLGVTGQGVSGLFVTSGFQADFPGQLQAQLIGILAVGLWGFVAGLIICAPLGLLAHGLQRSNARQQGELQPTPIQRSGLPVLARQFENQFDNQFDTDFTRPALREPLPPRTPSVFPTNE